MTASSLISKNLQRDMARSRFTIECPWCPAKIPVIDGLPATCSMCDTTIPVIRLDDARVFHLYHHTLPAKTAILMHHGMGDERMFHDSSEYGPYA